MMPETVVQTRRCPVCGKRFTLNTTGRPRLYDQRTCRDIAWRSGAAKQTRTTRDATRDATLRATVLGTMRRTAGQ